MTADSRKRLGLEVRDILREAGQTALLVTHSEDEAQLMADKINYLKNGRLIQNDEKTKIRNT